VTIRFYLLPIKKKIGTIIKHVSDARRMRFGVLSLAGADALWFGRLVCRNTRFS